VLGLTPGAIRREKVIFAVDALELDVQRDDDDDGRGDKDPERPLRG
jgi:hypothetical protein